MDTRRCSLCEEDDDQSRDLKPAGRFLSVQHFITRPSSLPELNHRYFAPCTTNKGTVAAVVSRFFAV